MAINNKPKTKASAAKGKRRNPGTTPQPVSLLSRLKQMNRAELSAYFKKESIRFLLGFSSMLLSLLLFMSIISNFFTGAADQSGVENGNLVHPANVCGKAGAYLSHYFMDECFGAFAFLIPVFTFALSLRLMNAYHIRLWKWFANCSILMIWGSVCLSLTSDLLQDFTGSISFRLGGGHGDYIKTQLVDGIGTLGAWAAIVAVAVFYLMYLTSETMSVIRKLLHPQDYIKMPSRPTWAKANADENEKVNDNESEDTTEDENPSIYQPEENLPSNAFSKEILDSAVPEDSLHEGNSSDDAHALSIELSTESSFDSQLSEPPAEETSSTEDALQPEADQPLTDDSLLRPNSTSLTIEKTETDDKAVGKTVEEVKDLEPYDPRKDLESYKFPTIPLLKHYDDNGPAIDMNEQNANKDRIINVLRNFGVEISSIKATIGPTITLYEVTPAPGVRINKIRNLEDDIALSLSALGIRIIAPIPGKGTIGIEVPNKTPRIVSMESIINTRKFQESTFELPIALGKTITNEVFMVDLAKMPHLLVAGATGQGKSVGLNAIITSLLYKKHPSELKFVMVDPKKVEFSIYAPIEKHFLAKIPDEGEDPIITDVTKVVQTLKSLCQLMDHRYDLLKKAKVRNIREYNAKFKARQLNPENGHEFMPYIVVIIDEFGDLIMTAGKEVEQPIARIAQLARAVGMHMVIATQRPTTNIITGTIKANFPARMAFKVMSQIDSRTILDQSGANQLIGKGDMLFLAGNMPVRVQCAFVDTPEVERINDFISHQQGYRAAYELPEPEMDSDDGGKANDIDASNLDPLFEEASKLIVIHQQGSTSLIQRKFAIGYNRAGRLMDQLERAGIVGPVRGSKPREVLVNDELELETILASLHART